MSSYFNAGNYAMMRGLLHVDAEKEKKEKDFVLKREYGRKNREARRAP